MLYAANIHGETVNALLGLPHAPVRCPGCLADLQWTRGYHRTVGGVRREVRAYFAHAPSSECPHRGESDLHHTLKAILHARLTKSPFTLGAWRERATPDKTRRADVLERRWGPCVQWRAHEIQLSRQSPEEYAARRADYERQSVECVWWFVRGRVPRCYVEGPYGIVDLEGARWRVTGEDLNPGHALRPLRKAWTCAAADWRSVDTAACYVSDAGLRIRRGDFDPALADLDFGSVLARESPLRDFGLLEEDDPVRALYNEWPDLKR